MKGSKAADDYEGLAKSSSKSEKQLDKVSALYQPHIPVSVHVRECQRIERLEDRVQVVFGGKYQGGGFVFGLWERGAPDSVASKILLEINCI